MLEATFAASLIGAVPVPVNWHWTGADLRHLLSDSQAKLAVVHSDLVPVVEAQRPEHLRIVEVAVPPEVAEEFALGTVAPTGRYPMAERLIEENDPPAESVLTPPMSVIYTSGTTGLAKGVLRDPIAPEKAGDIAALLRQVVGFRAGGSFSSGRP
jgi:long-chain acyl-CoA synthetase